MMPYLLRRQGLAGLLVAAALGLVAGAAAPGPPSFKVLMEKALPRELQRARDVRWTSDNEVVLAVVETGTVEIPLDPKAAGFKLLVPDSRRGEGIWLTSRLGLSSRYMAIGAPAFEVGWKKRHSAKIEGRGVFEAIEDLDLFDNRLAVLGTRRAEDRSISPDGAIAWTGSVDRNLTDLKPVLFSTAGPGARPMDSCMNFEIGAIRFLRDGALFIVPGTEPGAFLVDGSGKLLHTWQTEALGLEARCDFDDAKRDLMSQHPEPRWAWINQFKTVDEVLPLAQGPGLVIRSVSAAGTRWQLKVLRRGGAPAVYEIPITSPSAMTHLRGDVRGARIVWLVYEEGRPEKPIAIQPRLVVTEVPQ
jgi:hypothetical protein